MREYKPNPIDTTDIQLSASLQALMEKLARNAHDNWAVQRISDGWKYGAHRSDEEKTNPCLVDFDELPESEKEYDRKMAAETLKCIVKLGYRIQEPVREG